MLAHYAFARGTGAAPVLAGGPWRAPCRSSTALTLVPVCWLVCLGIYLARAEHLDRRARVWTGVLAAGHPSPCTPGDGRGAAVVTRLWSDAASPSGSVHESLSELGFYRQLARVLLGQAWYLVAASFGCAVLGVLWLVAAARAGTARTSTARATVVLTGLVAVAVFTTSAALASGIQEKLARASPCGPTTSSTAATSTRSSWCSRPWGSPHCSPTGTQVPADVRSSRCWPRSPLAGLVWVMLLDYRLPPYEPNIAGVIYCR